MSLTLTLAGDILVFLTGQAEIDKAVRALNDAVRAAPPGSCGDLMVLPIYAALPPEMQVGVLRKVMLPSGSLLTQLGRRSSYRPPCHSWQESTEAGH